MTRCHAGSGGCGRDRGSYSFLLLLGDFAATAAELSHFSHLAAVSASASHLSHFTVSPVVAHFSHFAALPVLDLQPLHLHVPHLQTLQVQFLHSHFLHSHFTQVQFLQLQAEATLLFSSARMVAGEKAKRVNARARMSCVTFIRVGCCLCLG